jgi:hypothetical protein
VTPGEAPRPSRERAWLAAAGLLVLAAAAARVHNAFAYPPLLDFDAAPHALNVFALYEGRLPDPRTWAGFHPPLYHAAGALVWHGLPAAIPVHAALRLLSAAAGFGAVAIAWRALRRLVAPADAAVVAAFVACAPVFAIATSMLGNETTCALFATAALARLLVIPAAPPAALRHAFATGLLAALAALAKSTGLGVVGVVALVYGWRLRAAGGRTLARLAFAIAVLPALLLAPHYGRLLALTGAPLAVISGGAPSDEAGSEMAAQPPGERRLSDYVHVPLATWVAPFVHAPGMVRSVPGLLHASTWADGHGQFLPVEVPAVVGAAAVGSILGLVPLVLALAGLRRLLRSPSLRGATGGPLLFGALLFAAFLVQTWLVPRYSAVKASYLLPALLPAAIALAFGLATRAPRTRAVLRAALLLLGAYYTFVTWYGWWV